MEIVHSRFKNCFKKVTASLKDFDNIVNTDTDRSEEKRCLRYGI